MHGPVPARMHRTSAAESRRPLLPPDAVRMLEADGKPIGSALDCTLTRR